MLKLIDRSPRLRSMIWTVIGVAGGSWLLRAIAALVMAAAHWR